MQVKVAADASSGIIYDFAYQSIADSSILAGNVEDGFVSVSNDNLEEVVIYAANKKLHLITGNESGNLAIYNLLGKQLITPRLMGTLTLLLMTLVKESIWCHLQME